MSVWVAGEPHICLGGCLDLWIIEPLGLVTVARPGTHLTLRTVQQLAGPVTDKLLALHALNPGPMRFSHDWTEIRTYASSARMALVAWTADLGRARIGRLEIQLGPRTPALVKMGVSVGASGVGVLGMHCDVYLRSQDRATEPPLVPHPKVRPFELRPNPRRPGKLSAQTLPPGPVRAMGEGASESGGEPPGLDDV